MSTPSREGIFDVLSRHYTDVRITLVNNILDLEELVERKPDLVFLGMGFIPSNPELGQDDPVKVWLCQYLDENDISYTGSTKLARFLETDKSLAKKCVIDSGLNSSKFFVTNLDNLVKEKDIKLSYPLFIKPANRGGGKGVDNFSVANNFSEAKNKIQLIADAQKTNSLVEEYLPGREFSVAILKNESLRSYEAMPIELVAEPDKNGDRMLSEVVKSSNNEEVSTVKDLALKAKITDLALGVFHCLGARDYGRIDIRLDSKGEPFFLEANLIPSLIEGYGSFPKACLLNNGLSYKEIILTITRLGLARNIEDDILPKTVNYLKNPKQPIVFA